ncbi:preprotein translocase subunit YajC [Campylobacter jejuni]
MAENSILTSLSPLVVLFAIFYFLVIRPQQKQAKAHKQMLESLQKGDKIITNGGLICEVVKPEEDFIKVKLNEDNVTAKISREFIAKKIDA